MAEVPRHLACPPVLPRPKRRAANVRLGAGRNPGRLSRIPGVRAAWLPSGPCGEFGELTRCRAIGAGVVHGENTADPAVYEHALDMKLHGPGYRVSETDDVEAIGMEPHVVA